MRGKKGFTLIEVLAVIVILAVLALISTPIIFGIIDDAKKDAFKETARTTVRTAEVYYASSDLKSIDNIGTCYVFNYSNDVEEKTSLGEINTKVYYQMPADDLELNGKKVTEGKIDVCGNYLEAELSDGQYTYILKRTGEEIVLKGSLSVNDSTAPIIDRVTAVSGTNNIKVLVNAHEEDSGVIDKYYYSIDGKEYFESYNNQYTFENLSMNTEYVVYVKVKNKSGLESSLITEPIITKKIANPTMVEASKKPASGYSYATERTIKITYTNTNINSPVYYFKTSVSATVPTGVVTASCGTGTTPGTCTANSVTTLVANTWYKTSTTTPSITYKSNGTLYALTSDGTNVSGTGTYTISKIDTTVPTITVTVDGKVATLALNDNIGVIGYAVTISTTTPTEWTAITSSTSSNNEWTASAAGTYYVWVKDESGRAVNKAFTIASNAFSSQVTYVVNGTQYKENIAVNASVLSPKTFTPTRSGATFIGWSSSPSSTAPLTSRLADGSAITLYAIFKYNDTSVALTKNRVSDPGYDIYGDTYNATYYSGIDMSKYSAATVTVEGLLNVNWRGGYWSVNLNCGGAATTILYPTCDWGSPHSCKRATYNGTLTLTFTGSSGLTDLTTTVTSSGTNGNGYINLSNLILTGRYIVG